MPLTRLEVRNEYGLGNPELYRGAARREDPRSVLDGVAVSGLVGILRQLGDLAGFASEIFHDLHEQILSTSARGHRVMARIQHIEATLPQIENAVQTQKSHIHFAYLPGCEWHANVPNEHEHLVCTDLPRFMMDSYEECRDPPRLFLLDKFDSAGAGACLKRYSDPSYFKSVWACSQMLKEEKYKKEKKVHRSKRKVQHMLNQEVLRSSYLSCRNSSIQITSPDTDNQSIAADTVSTSDMRLKSDIGSPSASIDSRTGFSCEETVASAKFSMNGALVSSEASMTKLEMDCRNECNSTVPDKHDSVADDDPVHDSLQEQNVPSVRSINWNEKKEILKPKISDICNDEIIENVKNTEFSTILSDQLKLDSVRIKNEQQDMKHLSSVFNGKPHHENSSLDAGDPTSFAGANHSDDVTSTMDECVDNGDLSFHSTNSPDPNNISSDARSLPLSSSGAYHSDEITSEIDNYVDAVNALASETDTDSEFQTIREVRPSPICSNGKEKRHESNLPKSDFLEDDISRVAQDSLHKKMSTEIESIFLNDVSCTQSLPTTDPDAEKSIHLTDPDAEKSIHLTDPDPEKSIHLNDNLSESTCGPPETTENNEIIDKQSLRCISDMQILSECSAGKLQTATEDEKVVEPYKIPDTRTNSDEPPVKMWTNGGLLGLEPSKPPDSVKPASLSTSKDGHSYSAPELQNDRKESLQPHESVLKNPCSNMKGNELHKSFGLVTPCNSQVHGKTVNEVELLYSPGQSPSCSYHGKFQNSHTTTIHKKGQNLEENKNDSPVTSAEVTSIESSPKNLCNSSSLPSLACKFLASNLQKKLSFDPVVVRHSTLEAIDSMAPKERSFPNDERKKHDTLASWGHHELNTNAKLEQELLEGTIFSRSQNSGPPSPPSPPLEHMKISFQPMNRTVTSKLKLEFPDDRLRESIEELMFPSFQLLPGSAASVNHLNSDSDDDTFFRSSSSYCEDVPNLHSDSDFELWESNEQHFSGNQDMLDASHTVSSTASMSVSLDLDTVNHNPLYSEAEHESSVSMENGIMAFQCNDVMDLPSLDSLNSVINTQEVKCDSSHKDPPIFTLEAPNEQLPTAQLPPLPPVHWRIMKSSLSYLEGGHDCRSEVANLSAGTEAQKSFQLQPWHAKCCPSQPPQTAGTGKVTLHSFSSMEPEKIDGDNKVPNAKETDERGDFLHQIRSKSFNLRRTTKTKQTFAPGPTTNVKVTAILEKANAIRQAVVSSDDGGDENWSDG